MSLDEKTLSPPSRPSNQRSRRSSPLSSPENEPPLQSLAYETFIPALDVSSYFSTSTSTITDAGTDPLSSSSDFTSSFMNSFSYTPPPLPVHSPSTSTPPSLKFQPSPPTILSAAAATGSGPHSFRQSHYSNSQFLDLEPPSPGGASTLVGSPLTPHSEQERFAWLAPLNSSSSTGVGTAHRPAPPNSTVIRFGQFDHGTDAMTGGFETIETSRKLSQMNGMNGGLGLGGGVNGGYSTEIHHRWVSGAPPHVAVTMDEISLSTISPQHSRTPSWRQSHDNSRSLTDTDRDLYMLNTHGNQNYKNNLYGGVSSNTSMITLLAPTHSNAATLLGKGSSNQVNRKYSKKSLRGSGARGVNLFGLFSSAESDRHSKEQQLYHPEHLELPSNHKFSEFDRPEPLNGVNEDPKAKKYTKRPKDKKFGKKAGGAKKAGGGGDGTRKALFSNERTFTHWIRFGILLGTMGMTLLNFAKESSLGYHVGVSVLVVAMWALIYATTTFHLRDRSLSRKLAFSLASKGLVLADDEVVKRAQAGPPQKPIEISYYDRIGPSVLCVALIIAYSINFYLVMSQPHTHGAKGKSYFAS